MQRNVYCGMQLKNDMLKRFVCFEYCFLFRPFPSRSLPSFDSSIWTETNTAIQVKEAAEKAMEEYRRDHPDIDESALKVDLPKAPAPNVQGQAIVAPGVMPNMYPPIPIYNPNPNPIVGQALVYPHVQPAAAFQPQPQHVPAPRRRQRVPQQPRLAPNARARAAAEELQRQTQRKRQATANVKAERARMAEQLRLAEEENRARQRLDRVRDQRAVARREQQERAWLALELERQRQGRQP